MSTLRALILIFTVTLVGCASGSGSLQTPASSDATWTGMPEPITQRYPMVEMQALAPRPQVEMAHEDYFSCSAEEESTLTDGLPLLAVSFIDTDILSALL